MKIPAKLKIGAQSVDIVVTETVKDFSGEVCLGLVRAPLNRIELSLTFWGEQIPESSASDTFLHEIIHFASETYGFDLTESQVAGLAGALLAIIRENDLDFRRLK